MTHILTRPDEMQAFANRKRWTRKDCGFLERYGVLNSRYELLDGEIIEKVGQNQPHAMTLTRIFAALLHIFGVTRVHVQTTIEVADADRRINRPEPDVFVLSCNDFELAENPSGSDLLLVVEVSDTTLRDDLNTKSTLYARAGVPEYWVMDVTGRRLLAHLDPADGVYQNAVAYSENESVAPQAAPDHPVRVGDLLPPLPATSE